MIPLLLACGGSPVPEEPRVRSALDDPAYRFCHEPGRGGEEALEWCDLLEGTPPERCPGLRETCEKRIVDEGRGCDSFDEGGDPTDRLAGAPPAPPRRWEGCDASGLSTLLRWIAAFGVAIAILVLFRFLWQTFAGRRSAPAPTGVTVALETAEEPLPDVPDAPSGDLLARAREALAAGRFGEAALLARGAALRHLGERGVVRLHRSSTDREYLRSAVRSDAETGSTLGVLLRAVEHHRFGGRGLDEDHATAAVRAAQRLLAVPVLLVLLAIGAGDAAAQGTRRYRPSGDAALLELFRLYGYDAGWRLTSLADLGEDDDVLVLDLTAVVPSEEQWDHVRTWVEAGAVLVVGGDATDAFPELGTHGYAGPVEASLRTPLLEAGLPAPRWPDEPPSTVFVDGHGRTFVAGIVADGTDVGALVEVLDLGPGVVVAIADPRLLWNAALVDPDNEVFLGELVWTGQSAEGWPVPTPPRLQLATTASAAAESSNGANNPFRSLASARLLPFVLQVLLLWTLVALWRGWPFAPLRDPRDEGRIGFVEHVEALGRRWARLRATRHAARAMATVWLSRLGPAGLLWAAERAGYAPEAARTWVREVEARAAGEPGGTEDHTWMEELWRVTGKRSR